MKNIHSPAEEGHMLRRSVAVAAVTLFTAAGVTFAATPAQAAACRLGNECVTTYYSDAAHTTVVGGKVEYCDGGSDSWGSRTGYFDYYRSSC
jgi:hypothetical protein